ncbi:Uncharacterised protein [Actinobacillus equuli]|nr:Uncharacterised protein [Actinobacillus equuli]
MIRRHQGMPVSVGAIVLYLAAALDLPLYPVNFPTQLILRAEMKDEKGKTTVRLLTLGTAASCRWNS